MLVRGLNDSDAQAHRVGRFIAGLSPQTAYLAVPIRPPAEADVQAPDEHAVNRYYQIVRGLFRRLEILAGYEGDAFAATGDLASDLLAVAAVHPMRESAVRELVGRSGGDWRLVEHLLADGLLVRTEYAGHRFYVRRLQRGSTLPSTA
jgi:wyosine [tRNA(Phe)-imidazoG37] synthetase (radical SAM superfamily)